MFRSKLFWSFILGVLTSVAFFEGKANLAYGTVRIRIIDLLSVPGTRVASALNTPGALTQGHPGILAGLAFACNFLVYLIFWYLLITIVAYLFARRHPYERENTLTPPTFR